MKKILLLVCFIILTVFTGYSQVKFMDIPIDGSKSEIFVKLKQKGFKYNQTTESLEGSFNGTDVQIKILTNKENKVWRIYVAEKQLRDEVDIKIRFNTIVNQFENKSNYISPNFSQKLNEDFDIYYQIRKTQISACFKQMLSTKDVDYILKCANLNRSDYTLEDLDYEISIISNDVWICISKLEYYNKYWISYYYDNLLNSPKGEDL
jgi:uncharacterized protein YxeA